jgi:hypothetical protein
VEEEERGIKMAVTVVDRISVMNQREAPDVNMALRTVPSRLV